MYRKKQFKWTRGLGAPMNTIEVPNAQTGITQSTTDLIEDCRYIGSYDWSPDARKGNPVIVVPGSPNVWVDPVLPLQVPADEGRHMRDKNNNILPGQPLLPLVVAVDQQKIFATEDWKTVDFVTDRNGLRKLLRWILGASGRDFRIDTQLIGQKTVILNRREPSTTEEMSGYTFGFNFEHATTESMPPATARSPSHHRIVTYMFGRFRIVVQFEVDGCLQQGSPPSTSNTEEDELAQAMATLGVSDLPAGQASSSVTSVSDTTTLDAAQGISEVFGLEVHRQGRDDIPHSSIVEMATLKSSGKFYWNDRYPQLYFSQTGNHHLGRHQDGEFYRIDKVTLSSPELQAAHKKLEPAFKKLEAALGQIQALVVNHGRQERLSLVYEQKTLKVYRDPSKSSCFPQEALKLFD